MWAALAYGSRSFNTIWRFPVLRLAFELKNASPPCGALTDQDSCVVRWIRPRGKNSEEHPCGFEPNKNSQAEGSQNGQNAGKPKVDSALLRKLRGYVLIIGGLSFVMSLVVLSRFPVGQVDMEGVEKYLTRPSFDVGFFFDKYLKAGEVRRIIFCPDHCRAVAFLHEGAVIDGKKVHEPVIVIAYTQGAQQFWADVRKEESVMGVSLSDGVRLDVYKGISTLRVVEFLIGMLLLSWLGIQYGRVLQQRMMSWKKKE